MNISIIHTTFTIMAGKKGKLLLFMQKLFIGILDIIHPPDEVILRLALNKEYDRSSAFYNIHTAPLRELIIPDCKCFAIASEILAYIYMPAIEVFPYLKQG